MKVYIFCLALWGLSHLYAQEESPSICVCMVAFDTDDLERCVQQAYKNMFAKNSVHFCLFLPKRLTNNRLYHDHECSIIPLSHDFVVDGFHVIYMPVILTAYAELFRQFEHIVILDTDYIVKNPTEIEWFTLGNGAYFTDTKDPETNVCWGGKRDIVLTICDSLAENIHTYYEKRVVLPNYRIQVWLREQFDKYHLRERCMQGYFVFHEQYRAWERPNKARVKS